MADPKLRLASNVPGQFYVDSECIDCDMCRATAPSTFTCDEATGLTRVYRQPTTPDEIALAQEALEACPADAIGRQEIGPRSDPATSGAA
jgi:ferredoxin